MMSDAEPVTVQQYVMMQAEKFKETDPEVVALYKEQQEIERLEKELEARKAAFDERLLAVGPYADKNFRVTDMRETRVLDMDLLKANFHDIWEKSIPSDKYLMESLKAYYGVDKICGIVKAMDESKYDEQRSLTLAEFDKAAGDSSAKKKYTGIAYHSKFTPTKKTRIESLYVPEMMKFPAKFGQNKLVEAEDDE